MSGAAVTGKARKRLGAEVDRCGEPLETSAADNERSETADAGAVAFAPPMSRVSTTGGILTNIDFFALFARAQENQQFKDTLIQYGLQSVRLP